MERDGVGLVVGNLDVAIKQALFILCNLLFLVRQALRGYPCFFVFRKPYVRIAHSSQSAEIVVRFLQVRSTVILAFLHCGSILQYVVAQVQSCAVAPFVGDVVDAESWMRRLRCIVVSLVGHQVHRDVYLSVVDGRVSRIENEILVKAIIAVVVQVFRDALALAVQCGNGEGC